jgi:FkbM family methyltransferase
VRRTATVAGAASPRAVLRLPGGVQVVVPDSLEMITPYVLREQGDWFEDELRFARAALRAGEKAIDVGANYGVYTLSLAAAAGDRGAVWAFEPAAATAGFLRESIERNGFRSVTLDGAALSDRTGTARLAAGSQAELNRLAGPRDAAGEEVPVKTLDQCMSDYGWSEIALLKLDAEGEEARIVRGGARFLAAQSPLVVFERKHDGGDESEAASALTAQGYSIYRLVPGMGLLVPADATPGVDASTLNLLACKPDRAAHLTERGLLVSAAALRSAAPRVPAADYSMTFLGRMPYAARLGDSWRRGRADLPAGGESNMRGIALYAASRDARLDSVARFACLTHAYAALGEACAHAATPTRLGSLARVAWELGQRTPCREALGRIVSGARRGDGIDLGEPFLPVHARFESLEPSRPEAWFLAAAIEQFERARHYSSYYTGDSALALIDWLGRLGYAGPEMDARRAVVAARAEARRAGQRSSGTTDA